MIEISTPTKNSMNNCEEADELIIAFNDAETEFYEGIKPVLNELVKEPSSKTINFILNFSKKF